MISRSNPPITEDDLHAYVDCVLKPERRADVESYLETHPEMARRVARFSEHRELLRAALAPIADEPLPSTLSLSRIVDSRAPRRSRAWWVVAAMLLVCIGGAGGWVLRGAVQPSSASAGLAALAQEASYSYKVYASDRLRPVEIRASDSAQLEHWASMRLHQAVKIPDLATAGYRLMGGRLVATAHGPAGMFMYDDDGGNRLVVLTRPMATDQSEPMTPHTGGEVSGYAWADGGVGYSVVGQSSKQDLRLVANEVRRQARAV